MRARASGPRNDDHGWAGASDSKESEEGGELGKKARRRRKKREGQGDGLVVDGAFDNLGVELCL